MAVQHPFAGIVEHAEDILRLTGLYQARVSQIPKAAVPLDLVKMMPVQVNAMREARVIHQSDPHGLAALETAKRCGLQVREVVEGPDIVTAMSTAHGSTLHGQSQLLRDLAGARNIV